MLDAKTPKASLRVESEDVRKDARCAPVYCDAWCTATWLTRYYRMLKDDRVKQEEQQTIFDIKGGAERLV